MYLLVAAVVSQQLGDRTPKELVQRIIRYEHRKGTGTRDPEFLSFFTPSLRRAIERDEAGDEVGALDYDPLCQCQDNDGVKVRVVGTRAGSSTAAVALKTGGVGEWTKVKLSLRRTGVTWRVADVSTRAVPSLAAELRAR